MGLITSINTPLGSAVMKCRWPAIVQGQIRIEEDHVLDPNANWNLILGSRRDPAHSDFRHRQQ
jgi:hypothetical protein